MKQISIVSPEFPELGELGIKYGISASLQQTSGFRGSRFNLRNLRSSKQAFPGGNRTCA
jgi:hypothetical protein